VAYSRLSTAPRSQRNQVWSYRCSRSCAAARGGGTTYWCSSPPLPKAHSQRRWVSAERLRLSNTFSALSVHKWPPKLPPYHVTRALLKPSTKDVISDLVSRSSMIVRVEPDCFVKTQSSGAFFAGQGSFLLFHHRQNVTVVSNIPEFSLFELVHTLTSCPHLFSYHVAIPQSITRPSALAKHSSS
jgi:hypothetical protein